METINKFLFSMSNKTNCNELQMFDNSNDQFQFPDFQFQQNLDIDTKFVLNSNIPLQQDKESIINQNQIDSNTFHHERDFTPNSQISKLSHQSKLKNQNLNSLSYEKRDESITWRRKTNQNQIKIPRYSQIQKSVQILRELVPQIFIDSFIDDLYTRINKRLSSNVNQKSKVSKKILSRKTNRLLLLAKSDKKVLNNGILQKRSFSNNSPDQVDMVLQNQSSKTQENVKIQEKPLEVKQSDLLQIIKIVAYSFCQKQWNEQQIRNEISKKGIFIQQNQLNFQKIIQNILMNAFFKLQIFLTDQCKLMVPSLMNSFGYIKLVNSLIKCCRIFDNENSQTLKNILKGQYGLGAEQVTQQQAMKLFQQIESTIQVQIQRQKMVKNTKHTNKQFSSYQNESVHEKRTNKRSFISQKKIQVKQIDEVKKMDRIWNTRYENQLIVSYKIGKTITQITEYFKEIFSKDKDAFSTVAMRSKLLKILRKSLRKFYSCLDKYGSKKLPSLKKIDNNQVRAILYNNDGFKVRILLLDVYKLNGYDQNLIINTIKEIIKYVNHLNNVNSNNKLQFFQGAEEKRSSDRRREQIYNQKYYQKS